MGHAGFIGIGAYASAILPTHFGWHPLLAMAAGAAIAGLLAALVARPIFKLKGHYLAMATLGLEPQLEKVAKGADVNFNAGVVQELVERYRSHASFEEERLLPLAQTILARHSGDLAELGLALHTRHVVTAARRGFRGS